MAKSTYFFVKKQLLNCEKYVRLNFIKCKKNQKKGGVILSNLTERVVVRLSKTDMAELEKIQKIEGGKLSTIARKLIQKGVEFQNLENSETPIFEVLENMLDAKLERLGNRLAGLEVKNLKNSGQNKYLLLQLLKEAGIPKDQLEIIWRESKEKSINDLKN